MARIPDVELERLKRETLVGQVRASGVALEKRGQDLVGLCPFHDDTDPSLVVTPSKGLWNCLGACQSGGSVIDWVMKREGLSFRRAVEWLLEREGGEPSIDLDPDASDAELLGAVASFYHETLRREPEGTAYLESRGLNDRELIKRFELGLANRTLGTCLPKKSLKAGERIRGGLQELGVLRKSGHEHLAGSLVVPIRNEAGEVVQLYGRKLRDDLRKGTPLHLYLPGAHRGIWNREAIERHAEAILCESLIDAMTFWCAGFRNVTAAYGTNGFTAELEAALAHAKRALLAFDRDDAGERAAKKIAKRLLAEGVECYRVQFPRGMDANEYAREVLPASKSLGVLIRSAEWMGSGPPPSSESSESGSLSVGDAGELNDAPELLPSLAAPSTQPPASPVPPPAVEPLVELDVREGEVWAELGGEGRRGYRVRGLERNTSASVLRVNLLAKQGPSVHVDTLDLYQARQRAAFVTAAAQELGADKKALTKDLARLLLALERHQEERARGADQDDAPKLTEAEHREALELLQDPRLLDRILGDFERAGLVGEETNKLVGYLAAVSRKLEEPLAVIIQSSSAAGKTSLMDAVLAFVPTEEREQYSALTGQSLFYMQDKDLAHKILAVVEEEGAERASYALKLLQSEGELTIASTGKDPETGKLVTHEYRVVGPVMIILTTTAVEIDEELLNRAIVLAVDEDRAQTRAIHRRQREKRTLEGLLARRAKDDLVRLHQNAQRLLRPLAVVNPYAPRLTFVDTRTRTRRDHEKYLTLIDTIALLHQHQREVQTVERGARVIEYIEVTPADIRVANRLAGEVLGRSLDELPPQTRRVLSLLDAWITAECTEINCERPDYRFTTREVREALGLGVSQTKVHLSRLTELEYLIVHRSVPGRPHVYELLYSGEGNDGKSFLPGLLDPDELEAPPNLHYDRKRPGLRAGQPGQNPDRPAPGRGVAGAWPGGGRTPDVSRKPAHENGSEPSPHDSLQIALLEEPSGSNVAGRNGAGQP